MRDGCWVRRSSTVDQCLETERRREDGWGICNKGRRAELDETRDHLLSPVGPGCFRNSALVLNLLKTYEGRVVRVIRRNVSQYGFALTCAVHITRSNHTRLLGSPLPIMRTGLKGR